MRVWTGSGGAARRSELRRLKTGLAAARRFGSGEQCASSGTPQAVIGLHKRLRLRRGLLRHLRRPSSVLGPFPAGRRVAAATSVEETGLGNVRRYRPGPPLNPSATWTVAGRSEMAELRDLLWHAGFTGRKLRELAVWGAAVEEYAVPALRACAASRLIEPAGERLPARAHIARRNARNSWSCRDAISIEALEALRHWSRRKRSVVGTEYTRWRARGSTHRRGTHRAGIRQLVRALAAARDRRRLRASRAGRRRSPPASARREQRASLVAAVSGSSARMEGRRGRWSSSGGGSRRRCRRRARAPFTGSSPAGGPRCFRSRVRRCRRRGRGL